MILLGRSGEYELSQQTVDALRVVYAGKDVERELALMHLWLLAHPARRPVRVLVFVKAWLKRARAREPQAVKANREARRANIAGLCGWDKRDDPSGVDGAVVQSPRLGVWEPDEQHVGGRAPGRHH